MAPVNKMFATCSNVTAEEAHRLRREESYLDAVTRIMGLPVLAPGDLEHLQAVANEITNVPDGMRYFGKAEFERLTEAERADRLPLARAYDGFTPAEQATLRRLDAARQAHLDALTCAGLCDGLDERPSALWQVRQILLRERDVCEDAYRVLYDQAMARVRATTASNGVRRGGGAPRP